MSDTVRQKLNTAFLTVGSDPFGLSADAWPLALDGRAAAADGFFPADRREPVMLAAPGTGPEGVVSDLFPMLPPGGVVETVIQSTLGPCLVPKEYPAARFCAILAESIAYDRMGSLRSRLRAQEQDDADLPDELAAASACRQLTDEIRSALYSFRSLVLDRQGGSGNDRLRDPELYEVSVGACCLTQDTESGQYILDVFTAGDYRVFLWDEEGLSGIYTGRSKPLSPDGETAMSCRRVRFERHRPFAVLLLSGSLCAFHDRGKAGKTRSLFDRLYLEQRLLQVMQDAVTRSELSARAIRMLGNPAAGQDSVSGGILLPPVSSGSGSGGTDSGIPADFRTACRERTARLEEILWLLSDKNAAAAPAYASCTEAERAYVRALLRRDPHLAERITDRLSARIGALIDSPDTSDAPALGAIPAEGCEPLRRLTRADVMSVFNRYDRENDGDRARIGKNRMVIRSVLSEHWMTLRPVLCAPGSPLTEPVGQATADAAAVRADACAMLAARITQQQAVIAHLTPLTESLSAAEEWIDRTDKRFSPLPPLLGGFSLPACVSETARIRDAMRKRLDEARDRLNSLFTAYTYERDGLFRTDTEPSDGGEGCLRTAYGAMMHGKLPASAWQWCLDAVRACPETRGYEDIFRALPVISADIAALERAVAVRSGHRRCIRELSEQEERLFDCLRAAVFADTAWGDDIGTAVGSDIRREYLGIIRKYQEDTRLTAHRNEVCAACLAAAGRFGDLGD